MKNVEDIYPLSPMQEVMLLHAQMQASEDVLLNQFCYEIVGALDEAAFRSAWAQVVDRHPALRSCFVWRNVKQSLQIVRKETKLPFEILDRCGCPAGTESHTLAELRQKDRELAFDLSKAPLQRFTLVRLADERYFFIWSSHHLLLDRWCLATLYEDLFAAYRANLTGQRWCPPRVRPFRDYINWIRQQDPAEAEAYWRSQMAGFTTPTLLTEHAPVGANRGPSRMQRAFGVSLTSSLHELAREYGLTPSVVVQGALALLVGRVCGQPAVCFGSVVSGRPPELPGVEAIVGSFINNVPVVVTVDPDRDMQEWFKLVQAAQFRRTGFDHVAVTDIQHWSELPRDRPLFDTLLVWLADVGMPDAGGLEISPLEGESRTAYPLTLSVFERGADLILQLDLKTGHRLREGGVDLLGLLCDLLRAIIDTGLAGKLSALGGFSSVPAVIGAAASAEGGEVCTYVRGSAARVAASTNIGAGREALDAALLEEVLFSEWRSLLGDRSFSRDDSFFTCGGNSLLAARLHVSVGINTRLAVPLIALFRQPTIRGMATTLSEQDWPLCPDIVVPVRATGSRTPLFCVASPDVNTLGYVQLSYHLHDEQPVYVLQSPPDSDRVRRLDPGELPTVAESYVAAMRQVQAKGPYRLLGMCTGAQLGFEMARQLELAGERVSFLGIVNTWAFFTVSWLYRLTRVVNRMTYYRQRLVDLRNRSGSERLALIQRALGGRFGRTCSASPAMAPKQAVGGSLAQPKVEGDGPAVYAAGTSRDLWIEDMGWAGRRGKVDKIKTPMTVFRIRRQQYWRIRDVTLGWGIFAHQVDVQHLSGKLHNNILREPDVREVAERIAEQLRLVQTAE